MADIKITGLTAIGALALADLLEVVDDPAGTPLSRKATLTQVKDLLLATQAEQETGTSTDVFVSPGRQHYHESALKVWGKCNTAGTDLASYNVTSITDTATGRATVTIATDFSGSDYGFGCTVNEGAGGQSLRIGAVRNEAAGSFEVTSTRGDSGAASDPADGYGFWAAGDQ